MTAVLAAVAAVVATVVLTRSTEASDVDLTTARLVPANAGIYFALNSDLSSSQWVAAFKLIERLGQDQPEKQLHEAVDGSGELDWDKDVAPFLGGNLALYFRSVGTGFEDFRGAAIIRCKDAKKCFDVLVREGGGDSVKKQHAGADYFEIGPGFAAVNGQHLILTNDEPSLFEAMDVAAGNAASLASVERFQQLRDELSKNFLAFVYLNNGDLFGEELGRDAVIRKAIQDSGMSGFALEPVAGVIGAKDAGFDFQEAASGRAGAVSPMLTPHDSRFAKLVPGNAALFVSTHSLAEAWATAVDAAHDQIDQAVRENSEYRNLDQALKAAGGEIGLSSARELIDLLHGEAAFAMWYPTGAEENVEGVFLAEADEASARSVLQRITASSPRPNPRVERVNNVDVTTIRDEDGEDISYAVTSGYLAIGTPNAVRAIVQPTAPALATVDRYKRTVAAAPSALGSYAYFDLAELLRLTTGGIAEELDTATAALDGLLLNMVNERDVARFNGIIMVKEK